jgi:hypothetical protein
MRPQRWLGTSKLSFYAEAGRNKARTLEDKYGKEWLIPKSEIDWGICLGKMMALAWVLGAEWNEAGDTQRRVETRIVGVLDGGTSLSSHRKFYV